MSRRIINEINELSAVTETEVYSKTVNILQKYKTDSVTCALKLVEELRYVELGVKNTPKIRLDRLSIRQQNYLKSLSEQLLSKRITRKYYASALSQIINSSVHRTRLFSDLKYDLSTELPLELFDKYMPGWKELSADEMYSRWHSFVTGMEYEDLIRLSDYQKDKLLKKSVARYGRLLSGNACDFCRMLAGRGAVYLSRASGNFRAHKFCHCQIYTRYNVNILEQKQRAMDILSGKVNKIRRTFKLVSERELALDSLVSRLREKQTIATNIRRARKQYIDSYYKKYHRYPDYVPT